MAEYNLSVAASELNAAIAKANAAAPQSTTYTKTEVNSAISSKVDKESGKGLSTNDFTNSDVSDLAEALAKALAAAPQSTTYTKTEVDTALAAKATVEDIFGVGTTIPENTDLNTYTTAGVFSCGATNAATLTNCPVTIGFRLEVVRMFSSNRRQQRIYPQDPNNGTFYIRTEGSSGFGGWFRFDGTPVATS